jgi:hypothetical protein
MYISNKQKVEIFTPKWSKRVLEITFYNTSQFSLVVLFLTKADTSSASTT